jgi:hypothetical protein
VVRPIHASNGCFAIPLVACFLLDSVSDAVSCPVLQYTYDTLVIFMADMQMACRVKLPRSVLACDRAGDQLLQKNDGAHAHRSPHGLWAAARAGLPCRRVPQTYLGLTLTCEKLKIAYFVLWSQESTSIILVGSLSSCLHAGILSSWMLS